MSTTKPVIATVGFHNINEHVPEDVHTLNDDRIFLIVYDGVIESATHIKDTAFRGEVSTRVIKPDAWIEFKENSK